MWSAGFWIGQTCGQAPFGVAWGAWRFQGFGAQGFGRPALSRAWRCHIARVGRITGRDVAETRARLIELLGWSGGVAGEAAAFGTAAARIRAILAVTLRQLVACGRRALRSFPSAHAAARQTRE